jgi:prepilin-type N-terminal cleavage/methylation domain-containing protein
MYTHHMRREKGFTLVEILIVVMIIAILAVIALFIFNPAKTRNRAWDIERKRELEQLRILFENYFLENLSYPTDNLVCYDTAQNNSGVCSCHICGLERDAGTFSTLVQLLYCDPEHGRKDYLYKYDCSNAQPLWYVIYGQLGASPGSENGLTCNYAVTNDQSKVESQPEGCLVEGGSGYNGSGGGPQNTPTPFPACPADPSPKFCYQGSICNNCGDFANCSSGGTCNSPLLLYSEGTCTNTCQ